MKEKAQMNVKKENWTRMDADERGEEEER